MTMTMIPLFEPDPISGLSQRTVTSSGPIGASDQIILTDQSAPITLTLPSGVTDGFFLAIKDISGTADSNPVTIECAPGDSIDLGSDYTLDVGFMSIMIGCDGAGRFFIV